MVSTRLPPPLLGCRAAPDACERRDAVLPHLQPGPCLPARPAACPMHVALSSPTRSSHGAGTLALERPQHLSHRLLWRHPDAPEGQGPAPSALPRWDAPAAWSAHATRDQDRSGSCPPVLSAVPAGSRPRDSSQSPWAWLRRSDDAVVMP